MTRRITTIGFDADDTLWHNESVFKLTQAQIFDMLADHAEAETIEVGPFVLGGHFVHQHEEPSDDSHARMSSCGYRK